MVIVNYFPHPIIIIKHPPGARWVVHVSFYGRTYATIQYKLRFLLSKGGGEEEVRCNLRDREKDYKRKKKERYKDTKRIRIGRGEGVLS